MIKTYLTIVVCLFLIACDQQSGSEKGKTGMAIVNDTIPPMRSDVKTGAVANYSEPVPDKDKLNNWKFSVDAFETNQTFKYLLKIQYKELRVEDTLTVPNFGIEPKVLLNKGSENLTCIIGFAGKEGEFKEYKKVHVEDGELKITNIKGYRRTLSKKQ